MDTKHGSVDTWHTSARYIRWWVRLYHVVYILGGRIYLAYYTYQLVVMLLHMKQVDCHCAGVWVKLCYMVPQSEPVALVLFHFWKALGHSPYLAVSHPPKVQAHIHAAIDKKK